MAYTTGKKTTKSNKAFKPCAGCKTKAKCRAAGKCLGKRNG